MIGGKGTGPGEFAPDGCAVELYARLPTGDEVQIVESVVPPPARLLELGCGAGRVTHELVAVGYDVTAVDNSAAMLERVSGARTVLSPIEELDLGETFDVVVFSSFLVHQPDAPAMLDVCRRHVTADGYVLIQREGLGWHEDVPRSRPIGDGVARVVSNEDAGDGLRTVLIEYEFPDATWTHTFRSRPLSGAAFQALLRDAGLVAQRNVTPDGMWVAAAPRS